MRMQDIRAIVTGGASGLGRAVADDIVAAGGRVVLFDVNHALGSAAVAELGTHASFATVDVTDEAAVGAAVTRGAGDGGLDLCVNCAESAGRSAWSAGTGPCRATSSAR